jgi:hypothetical protein
MQWSAGCLLSLCALASVMYVGDVSAQAAAPPAGSIRRFCSARPASAVFAQSMAAKIKAAFDAGATAGKRSAASVRVNFSPSRTRPQSTAVDFSKDVSVAINVAAATDKITFTGTPAATTLYQSCDPGRITFTVLISYRDLSKTPAAPVNIRQSIDVTIPGQYL